MIINRKVKSEAKQLFRSCLANGLLDEDRVRQAVRQVIAAGHRDCQAVLTCFLRLVRLDRAQHTASIQTAAPLPPDLEAATIGGLSRRYGPGLATELIVHESLIGGMRIQVGSDVYDGSVLARLAALEKGL
jgi:F-type H+-transporting ATPase subunit delta